MSSASYAAWAQFDVEKELERVDQAEQREQQHKQQLRQERAKQSVESSATQAAQQSADILAAQAAVAALKAKKRVRRGRAAAAEEEEESSGAEADGGAQKAAKLQAQAALFARKHELLQQVMESRRLGQELLSAEQKNCAEAQKAFETALDAVKRLEELAPELLKAEEEQAKLLGTEPAATSNQQQEKSSSGCGHSGEKEHSCGDGCSHGDKRAGATRKPEALPKANDLMAIIRMFYKDTYMGIGICGLERGRLAAATEAFKEVLLRDEMHLSAWLRRGEAFERMDAPLLAMLHYSRITNLDAAHEKGKESLDRVKAKLLASGDACNDKDTVQREVSECTNGRAFKEVLERIQWMFEEANVIAVESFFDYSTTKYQVVVGCLEVLRARPEFSTTNEEVVSAALSELEISCHLNIASGCLEMQRNYSKAINHCEQALHLDRSRAIIHFRMGQIYHALHSYEKALGYFEAAKALVPTAVSEQTEEQQKRMLTAIAKESDKCEFDRNQYDVGYLRSLATK
ncbi:Tetratricopeptide repeat-containing domain [Phytophthora cinnamomi]|uniref:Tetratricopeptide repeat-containing domain n=1 Tax=Phytophthora cinnamomi TaxID=4785 RepID=UPI00355ACD24|nr:Tetratricopeptide repeat-containing domain [Phytophthora cinnamomi]